MDPHSKWHHGFLIHGVHIHRLKVLFSFHVFRFERLGTVTSRLQRFIIVSGFKCPCPNPQILLIFSCQQEPDAKETAAQPAGDMPEAGSEAGWRVHAGGNCHDAGTTPTSRAGSRSDRGRARRTIIFFCIWKIPVCFKPRFGKQHRPNRSWAEWQTPSLSGLLRCTKKGFQAVAGVTSRSWTSCWGHARGRPFHRTLDICCMTFLGTAPSTRSSNYRSGCSTPGFCW